MKRPRNSKHLTLRPQLDGSAYVILRGKPGSWDLDVLTARQARRLGLRLIAMADWIETKTAGSKR